MRGKTIIIQGGQYGSEGKGQIAAEIAGREGVTHAVRTGSINAGHTVYYKGQKFSMQIIPTPWVHPHVKLVLGAGTYIEPSILANEVKMINEAMPEHGDVRQRLFIDPRCVWFGEDEHKRSVAANRHHAMGATGKGCSEAIISKMRDRGDDQAAFHRMFVSRDDSNQYTVIDTVALLNNRLNAGEDILLEGTQGALLDFVTGPYPFVTSRMTSSAAWLAEAGLPPINVDTVLVLRSHPIRVAGNSGPMPDEIDWPTLARRLNKKLTDWGFTNVVAPEFAIRAFEVALENAIFEYFPHVADDVGKDFITKMQFWSDAQRVRNRVCLSEANAIALRNLPPEIVNELAFFEKTTVTKKLRRISQFNVEEARKAVMMNGPARIAYTFLNYDFPQLYNVTDCQSLFSHPIYGDAITQLERDLGVRVDYVSTGPLPEHVLPWSPAKNTYV